MEDQRQRGRPKGRQRRVKKASIGGKNELACQKWSDREADMDGASSFSLVTVEPMWGAVGLG